MNKEDYKVYSDKMRKSIDAVNADFASVRAGRANASVLDRISVDYYGSPTPIQQIASVSTPDARSLLIQPWDASVLKGIEKAIKYAEWDKIELDENGKLKGANDHIKAVRDEWAEYVTTTTTTGAKTSNPPANNGGKTGKTKEEIMAIRDPAVRQAEIAKNPEAFGLKFD